MSAAATKKAPRAKAAAKKAPPLGRDALAAIGRGALALVRSPDFGRIVVTALVAAGFVAASVRVKERVLASPTLSIEKSELATTPLPPFLSERAREDLAALPIQERVSAFHPALVRGIAYSLGRVPWVESVRSVELGFALDKTGEVPAHVHFALEAARPIARIHERGQEVLVARSRRRVPADRFTPGPRPLPRIEGLPGESSVDREPVLESALALIAALDRATLSEPLRLEALTIDARGDAWLECGPSARIEWGRLASTPALTTEERIARLQGFLARGPALATVERLALEWDDAVYVLKPVAPAAAEASVAAATH